MQGLPRWGAWLAASSPAAGAFVACLAAWGNPSVSSELRALALVLAPLFGGVMLSFLILAAFSLPPLVRSREARQRTKRGRELAAKLAADQERERRIVEPLLPAWEAFHPAACEMVAAYRALRDQRQAGEPHDLKGWREFKEKARRTVELAAELRHDETRRALGYLMYFVAATPDDLGHCPDLELMDWMTDRHAAYFFSTQKAGLPAPKYDSPVGPPSPTSSG